MENKNCVFVPKRQNQLINLQLSPSKNQAIPGYFVRVQPSKEKHKQKWREVHFCKSEFPAKIPLPNSDLTGQYSIPVKNSPETTQISGAIWPGAFTRWAKIPAPLDAFSKVRKGSTFARFQAMYFAGFLFSCLDSRCQWSSSSENYEIFNWKFRQLEMNTDFHRFRRCDQFGECWRMLSSHSCTIRSSAPQPPPTLQHVFFLKHCLWQVAHPQAAVRHVAENQIDLRRLAVILRFETLLLP